MRNTQNVRETVDHASYTLHSCLRPHHRNRPLGSREEEDPSFSNEELLNANAGERGGEDRMDGDDEHLLSGGR